MLTKFLTRVLVTTLSALFAAYLLKGVHIDSFQTAIILAIVLALLNTFIKPILVFFTLPITILTLGLFLLVINILIIKWAADLVPGFDVDGWWPALLFSLLVSFVSSVLEGLLGDNKNK
ncbi:MAG: phage holin family protein [Segetibacter sp.]|nr:phage holin family protein [Segetibacter sp.]